MASHLSSSQLRSFDENGFLAIESLLEEDDLTPIEREYAELLDQVADKLYSRGLIPSRFEDLPFGERYARMLGAYPYLYAFLNISLPLINGPVEPEDFSMHAGPAVFELLRNPKLLDLVESILGPEITSNPIQQMRLKPPERGLDRKTAENSNIGATTWHQDTVAILPEAEGTRRLTAWVAITEATEENGCLLSVPGSHRNGEVPHCPGRLLASEPHIPESVMGDQKVVALPIKRGGVVLFNKHNYHCALPNRSGSLRWSLDLRYTPVGQPTGRPAFPGFVARSRSNPASELRDAGEWKRLWDEARERIVSGRYKGLIFEHKRWDAYADTPICA